jgi:hypothetical protein
VRLKRGGAARHEAFASSSRGKEIEYGKAKFGPLIMARRPLEAEGRWEALLGDLRRLIERRGPAEYLVILGARP